MSEYLEWAKHYFKSKDVFKKEIKSINEEDSSLIITKSNSSELIYCLKNNISEISKDILNNFDSVWIVCKDSADLTRDICDSWEFLTSFDNLKLLSINLKTGSKWILNPLSHSKIIEPKFLKKSLDILRSNA